MQYVKISILKAFNELNRAVPITELLDKLQNLTHAKLERNIRHYYKQGLVIREKIAGTKKYQYQISEKGKGRLKYLIEKEQKDNSTTMVSNH